MPRDFDVDRRAREQSDRGFTIGGRDFVYRAAVAPESVMKWSDYGSRGSDEKVALEAAQTALRAAEAQNFPATRIVELAEIVQKRSDALKATIVAEDEWIRILDDTILACVEPQYAEAWKEIRSPDAVHPLGVSDLTDLLEWLVEEAVNRPTGQPSVSSRSGGDTETPLTVDSSLPAEPALIP